MLASESEANVARTTILLDDDLMLEVKQLARADATTVTEVIREALKAYRARRQRARTPSFTGMGRSGRRSISKRAKTILRRKVKGREGW